MPDVVNMAQRMVFEITSHGDCVNCIPVTNDLYDLCRRIHNIPLARFSHCLVWRRIFNYVITHMQRDNGVAQGSTCLIFGKLSSQMCMASKAMETTNIKQVVDIVRLLE